MKNFPKFDAGHLHAYIASTRRGALLSPFCVALPRRDFLFRRRSGPGAGFRFPLARATPEFNFLEKEIF